VQTKVDWSVSHYIAIKNVSIKYRRSNSSYHWLWWVNHLSHFDTGNKDIWLYKNFEKGA